MAKRTYRRRSDAELIEEYRSQIEALETKLQQQTREDQAVLEELPKLKRRLAGFAQLCIDNGRNDLSNSVLAFLNTIERQAKQIVS
ncbi:MAG: hypothetical protein R3F17_06790 [Planctomycetota bacterium]